MSYISAITKDNNVIVWERNVDGRTEKVYPAPLFFYTPCDTGKYFSIYQDRLEKHTFSSTKEFYAAKQKNRDDRKVMFESDIPPELRVLSSEYYGLPAPKLNITFYDIEVDYDPMIGFSSPDNPYAPINAIAILHHWSNQMVVLAVPPNNTTEDSVQWTPESLWQQVLDCDPDAQINDKYNVKLTLCQDEKQLLLEFLTLIEDSDVICGWNSDLFDTPYVAKRIEAVLGSAYFKRMDFAGTVPRYRDVVSRKMFDSDGKPKKIGLTLDLQGRIRCDYMDLYKKYEVTEKPSYKLASIEQEVGLNLPKLEYAGSLADLYTKNFPYFIRYNIRDTEILGGFEDKLGYVDLANQMYHISCGLFSHVTGTIKLAEYAIVNYCQHELNRVVPDFHRISDNEDRSIEGALVLLPQVGEHKWTGSIDINSLYPSAIRSINISPDTIVGQFVGCANDVSEMYNRSDKLIGLELESTEELIELPAHEWRQVLLENKWAVSGYGTVFDQNKPGIIPTILSTWYAQRKKYQALKKQTEKDGDHELSNYYDRLQYVYKIKLNSLYGALTNLYFRFFDLRLGESTTATGRAILRHQCRKVSEVLGDGYNVDFPLYADVKDGGTHETALNGPKFNGVHQSKSVIYGDSVSGDSLIDTPEGQVEIQQLFTQVNATVGNKEYCNTSDSYALTYDKDSGLSVFKPISYVMRHKTTKQMYRVWITNSQYVDVTEDHALIGYKNSKRRVNSDDYLHEITAQQLGVSGGSLIYRKTIPRTTTNVTSHDPDLVTLAGYIMGDGYVDTTDTGGVLLSIGALDLREIEEKLLLPLMKKGYLSSWCVKPNGHDVQISSVKLRKTMREWLYEDGHNKRTPQWMMSADLKTIQCYIRGWFSADGWVSNRNIISMCNVHQHNIQDMHKLLGFCGVSASWFTEQRENSYKGKLSGTFTKKLTVKTRDVFAGTIGFIQHRKQTAIKLHRTRDKSNFNHLDFDLVRAVKIEKLPTVDQYVYDIEVGDTHMFFANGILVHNTDSTYFATHATDLCEAIEVADAVADAVNKSYTPFMREMFLCTEGYDSIIAAAREIVSDNGIFVDKKRYILHIVDQEGKPADKTKAMGLDTKKTTIPRVIGDKLNEFITRYLKGTEWNVIAEEVVAYKEHLRKSADIMDLGLPKGVQNVETYAFNYSVDATTRLPGHVAAAIFYNQCLKQYDDRISRPIISGMKIKVFYLTQKHGRFKSIAIPTDAEFVPQWFYDNFEIDYDAHIKRLVDNPLENIIRAIGKKSPTKRDLLLDSVFVF